MHRVCALELNDRSRLASLILALLVALPLLMAVPSPAEAQDPVEEIRTLCVYKGETVYWGESPGACKSSDDVYELPGDYPITLCVDVGEKIELARSNGSCEDDDLTPLTIPDAGPVIMCAKNRKNGEIEKDRAEVEYQLSPLDCDKPKYWTPYVTPTPPVAHDDTYTTDEDTQLNVPAGGVLENDTDYNPGTVQVHQLTQPAIGTVTLNADGSLSYDPSGLFDHLDDDESQDITFTYNISDGELVSNTATVTLTITGVNDAPVANYDEYTTDEDTNLFIVPPGVLGNDTDAEGHALTAHIVPGTEPAAGDLTVNADGSINFDPAGEYENLDTHEASTFHFQYVARDGKADSAAASVRISVTGVNDAPVAGDDLDFTTDENTTLTITAPQLLANDTDVDLENLSITDVGIGTPSSSFTFNANNNTISFDPRTDFDYLRDGQTGFATITYRATDGDAVSERATVRIAVTGLSTPEAQDDFAETAQGDSVEIDILANDTVPAAGADVVEVTLVTTRGDFGWDPGTGLMTYDPNGQFDYLAPGQNAKDRFGYRLVNAEGESRTAVVTVIVYGTNDPPMANDDTQASGAPIPIEPEGQTVVPAGEGVLANDSDVDPPDHPSGQLTATLIAPPERGRLSLGDDGGFSFDAAGELAGDGDVVTFRYRATDGLGESSTALVELVVGINPAPVFDPDTLAHQVFQNTPPGGVFGTVVAFDSGGEIVTFSIADNPSFLIDATTGELRLAGPVPALGTYTVDVTATDEQGQATTETVTVQVLVQFAPTDDTYEAVGNVLLRAGSTAPAATSDIVIEVGSGVLANDGAQDGTVVVDAPGTFSSALGGRVELLADGSFSYLPPRPDGLSGPLNCDQFASGWDGSTPAADSFTYTARDTLDNATSNQTVTITLTDVVWVVDGNATVNDGCGTAERPFATLGEVSSSTDDGPGDTIYVRGGGLPPYTDGVTLDNAQILHGEGVALSLGGHSLAPAGTAPVIAPESGEAILLRFDHTLHGFSVDASQRAIVSTGLPIGTTVIDLPSVSAGDEALRLIHGGTLQATIPVISGGNRAIYLDAMNATLTAQQVAVSAPGGDSGLFFSGVTGALSLGEVTTTGGDVGLLLQNSSALVDIDTMTSDATASAVISTNGGDTVTIDNLVTTGGSGYVIAGADASQITLNTVDMTVNSNAGLSSGLRSLTAGAGSSITIGGGTIRAGAGFDDALVRLSNFHGTVDNGADVHNGDAAAAAGSVDGRSIHVDGLGTAAVYTQAGEVRDRGDGILVSGNHDDATVLLEGDMDIATDGTPALSVDNSPFAASGPNSTLRSLNADVVHLDDVLVGDDGVLISQVDATDGGIYLRAVVPASGGALGTVEFNTGSITEGGITVDASEQVIIGSLALVDPPANGITTLATTAVRLEGTRITRAFATGVSSTDDNGLVLAGVTIESPGDSGIDVVNAWNGPDLQAHISDAAGEILHVTDDGTNGPNTVLLNGLVGTGGAARVPGLLIEASASADLRISGSETLMGGRVNGVDVQAITGATVSLDTARITLSGADVPTSPSLPTPSMMLLHADGAGSTIGFDLDLVEMVGLIKGHGLRAMTTDGGQVGTRDVGGVPTDSRMREINIIQPGGIGIYLEDVDGVRFDKTGVRAASTTGIAVWNSADVRITDLTMDGTFSIPATEEGEDPEQPGNAIDLWGSENVIIRQGTIDMSDIAPFDVFDGIPFPPTPTEQIELQQTRLEEACDDASGEAISGSGTPYPGQVGVFGRHLTGDIEVANLEIQGGNHSHVLLFNGDDGFADDKTTRPTPNATGSATFTIGGLSSYQVQPFHFGTFVGAHDVPSHAVAVDFSGQTGRGDGRTQICASNTDVGVTGSPVFDTDALPPVLSFSTSTNASDDVNVSLQDFSLSYHPEVLTPDQATVAEDWGAIGFFEHADAATLTNGSISDAPGPGLLVPVDLTLDNVTITDALGDGVETDDSHGQQSLTMTGSTIVGAGDEAVKLDGIVDVEIADSSIAGATGGLVLNGVSCLTATNNTFSGPPDIRLLGPVGLLDYRDMDDPPNFEEDEQYWFATRNGNTFTTLNGVGNGFPC